MRLPKVVLIFLIIVFSILHSSGQTSDKNWTEIDVTGYQSVTYSHPMLIDFNPDVNVGVPNDVYDIINGADNGTLRYQYNVGNNTNFNLLKDESARFSVSFQRAAISSADYNNDNLQDIIIGDKFGALHLYLNDGGLNFLDNSSLLAGIHIQSLYAKPTIVDMNQDGTLDIVVGEEDGLIRTFINHGTWDNPNFSEDTSYFGTRSYGSHVVPFALDPDGDGINSFIVGTANSGITFLQAIIENGKFSGFETISSGNSANPFDRISNFDHLKFITPSLKDINNDGYLDLIFGAEDGSLHILINPSINFAELTAGFSLLQIALISIVVLLLVIGITIIVVRRVYQKKGRPLYLMVIQDIGIAPFDFKFDEGETMKMQDAHLAGGAFTGIQSIINEITASDLNSFETGENRILISRAPFASFDGEVQVLLWSTEDDKQLRELSEKLATYIANNLAHNFNNSTFDITFTNVITSKIQELFSSYI